MSENEIESKAKELAEAVKKLKKESERLKSNLDRMHQLQSTLYETDKKLIKWLEAGNKIEQLFASVEKEMAR